MHDRDQDRRWTDGRLNLMYAYHPVAIHWQIRDGETELLQKLAGTDDSGVLNLRRDNVVAFLPQCKRHALDRGVVGFTATTGEDNLVRVTAQETGCLFPRFVDSFLGVLAVGVQAGGIAKLFVQKRPHCLRHSWVNRCCRVVIKIDHARQFTSNADATAVNSVATPCAGASSESGYVRTAMSDCCQNVRRSR